VRLSAAVVPVCLAAIALTDALRAALDPPLLVDGLLDEVAHAATMLLGIAAFARRVDVRLLAGAVLGAVLIDVDHIPRELGWYGLEQGGTRPYSHGLATVALLLAAAFLLRRLTARHGAGTVLLGAAIGLVLHLFRDLAVPARGPGVALFWPLDAHVFTISYAAYWAVVLAAACAALWARRPPAASGQRA
jgi:membrane-bound metal-dependent hydrolase YbcI (DUF457 family)